VKRKIALFDTSVVNRLFDDGLRDQLVLELHRTRHVYLPFVVMEEIVATPKSLRRTCLYDFCAELAEPVGNKLLYPVNETLTDLISQFYQTCAIYELKSVKSLKDVRSAVSPEEIMADNDLSKEALLNNRALKAVFEARMNTEGDREKFLHDFPQVKANNPCLTVFAMKNRGDFLAYARDLYSRVVAENISDEDLDLFTRNCLQLNSLITAFCVATHERMVDVQESGDPAPASWNDVIQALYAPYCDEMFMRDAPFHKTMTATVKCAGLTTAIRTYEELRKELLASRT
jgi:hypothetical protein